MGDQDPPPVADTLRQWISLDDESRRLKLRIKEINDEKARLGSSVLDFMRENEVDDFKLDGMSGGSISRQVRTIKPAAAAVMAIRRHASRLRRSCRLATV